MKETELHSELKTLFERMGKLNVRITHGPNEKGRDLVFDEIDDQGFTQHVAVVVKRGDVNGRTTGHGSAGDIDFQIRLCFGAPTIGLDILSHRQVNKVIVIASGTFNEYAISALEASRRADQPRNVVVWDGDRLWELFTHYMGPATLFSQIGQACEHSSRFSENYAFVPDSMHARKNGIIATIETGGVMVHVAAKSESSPPLTIKFKAKVHKSRGSDLNDALRNGGRFVFQDGESASVEYIDPALSHFSGPISELSVHPHISTSQDFLFQFQGSDEAITFEDRFSRKLEAGLVLLDNSDTPLRPKFTLKFAYDTLNGIFENDLRLALQKPQIPRGYSVKDAISLLRLLRILSKPSTLSVYLKHDNLFVFRIDLPGLIKLGTCSNDVLEHLEMLEPLQDLLKVQFTMPKKIKHRDLFAIKALHQIVSTGEWPIKDPIKVKAVVDRELYQAQLPLPDKIKIDKPSTLVMKIFSRKIELKSSHLGLSNHNFTEIREESISPDITIESEQPVGTASRIFECFNNETDHLH